MAKRYPFTAYDVGLDFEVNVYPFKWVKKRLASFPEDIAQKMMHIARRKVALYLFAGYEGPTGNTVDASLNPTGLVSSNFSKGGGLRWWHREIFFKRHGFAEELTKKSYESIRYENIGGFGHNGRILVGYAPSKVTQPNLDLGRNPINYIGPLQKGVAPGNDKFFIQGRKNQFFKRIHYWVQQRHIQFPIDTGAEIAKAVKRMKVSDIKRDMMRSFTLKSSASGKVPKIAKMRQQDLLKKFLPNVMDTKHTKAFKRKERDLSAENAFIIIRSFYKKGIQARQVFKSYADEMPNKRGKLISLMLDGIRWGLMTFREDLQMPRQQYIALSQGLARRISRYGG